MGAHDLGHIPFSHGAEAVLPKGTHHEQLSVDVILSDEMREIWSTMKPPIDPLDVAKVAVGLKDWPRDPKDFTPWDELLTEIVTGNAFGADRADYLLRDSHHAGVAYGRFDHHRLVDTLRVLRAPGTGKPTIGIERGGVHAAEGLQLARYFMFEQLYYHRVRRALDLHLRETSCHPAWRRLPHGGRRASQADGQRGAGRALEGRPRRDASGHEAADRILSRRFYRVLYEPTQDDLSTNINAVEAVLRAAETQFGAGAVARDRETKPSKPMDFAVWRDDGQIVSSLQESKVLERVPAATFDRVFIVPELREEAERWLKENVRGILQMRIEEEI